MEINDRETLINLLELNSEKTDEEGTIHAKTGVECKTSSTEEDDERLASTEALLNNLIHSVCGIESHSSSNRDAKVRDSHKNDEANCDIKRTATTAVSSESPRLPFQLSDSMKKGLSMLAFPSKKSSSRKKGITSSRSSSNSRITIGEALEKAQDARKSISNVTKGADESEKVEGTSSSDPSVQHLPVGSSVGIGAGPPESTKMDTGVEMGLSGKTDVDMRVTVGEKENWTDATRKPAHSVPASPFEGPHNDQQVSLSTSSIEGKRVPLAGKAKSSAATRLKLSSRMWELLRFTFIHEHFPTSVHMARLAKMMGVQWSQVRNWFTDRRVENKKAGIFPRDKVLEHCPYCDVPLEREVDQKSHLFTTQHVRRVLGPEFAGGNASESIKWKKLPNGVNAVSKSSGARVLAVGYASHTTDTQPGTEENQSLKPKKLTDAVNVTHEVQSEKLQKRWTESVLLKGEKEQKSQWNALGTAKNNIPVGLYGDKGQEKEESILFIKMEDGEEKIVKSGSDYDIPSAETLNTEKSNINANIGAVPMSVISNVSVFIPSDPCSSKNENLQHVHVTNVPEAGNIKLSNISSISLTPIKSPQKGEKTEVSQLPEVLLKEPKLEKDCNYEEVGKPVSTTVINKVNLPQEQEKKFITPVQVPEQTVPTTSFMCPVEMTPVFSPSLRGTGSKILEPCVSKQGTRASEGFHSNAGLQQPFSKRIHNLRMPYTGSLLPRSYRNIKYPLDETAILGYQCPTCNKIFQTEWLMIKHSLTHFKYLCDICEQVFASENLLKRHMHDHLTGAYEDEKYYCQFSCKTCHSLICECYEPIYCRPKEMPKGYVRPQKARRSKKTFISKPNSGPNDHLIVTLADYKRFVQSSSGLGNVRSARPVAHLSQKSITVSGSSSSHLSQKLPIRSNIVEKSMEKSIHLEVDVKDTKLQVDSKECVGQNTPEETTVPMSSSRDTTQEVTNINVADIKVEPVSSTVSEDVTGVEEECESLNKGKRSGSRRRASKLSSNFIYKDTDFYYMCEMCDASFLSRAELSEHMFFHRLKSRSRRGEKRGTPGTAEEEREEVLKRLKVEELQNSEEVETINVGGFERFKCPLCKGHFESVPDLNRHRTQAHKGPDTDISPDVNLPARCTEVFQCTYCEKLYRRERELRRHLKHDCVRAPKYLKTKLAMGVTLTYLENLGDGPHYRIVKRNPDENSTNDLSPSKTPLKGSQRGPITCKYCNLVTRREAEMKRHVWKYCTKVPKDVVKSFKGGATLEELGFVYNNEKLESSENSTPVCKSSSASTPSPASNLSPPANSKTISSSPVSQVSTSLPVSQVTTSSPVSQVTTSSPVSQVTTSLPVSQVTTSSPVSQVTTSSPDSQASLPVPSPMLAFPLPMVSFAKSKEPLVCSYCGIWYFREVAIMKHMKERCIRLPPFERELLKNGGRLCTIVHPESGNESSELCKAIYKKVEIPAILPSSVQNLVQANSDPVSKDSGELRVETKASDESKKEESIVEVGEAQAPVPVTPAPTTGRGRSGPSRKGTRCRRCHETFKSPDAVLAHSSVHHGPKKGFYKCKLCQIRLVKYKQLREHVWEHTDETPYRCHVCEVKFRSSDNLVEHLKGLHNYNLITERNLYKWLPGRNGRYREIKPIVKDNCEESLEDVDTSLENLAEVMVITDSDIWTNGNEKKTSADKEKVVAGKLTKAPQEEVSDGCPPSEVEKSDPQRSAEGDTSEESESQKCIPKTSDDEVNQSTIPADHSVPEKESVKDGEKDHVIGKTDLKAGQDEVHVEEKTVKVGEDTVEQKEKCAKARDESEKLGLTSEKKEENSNVGSESPEGEEESTDSAAKNERNKSEVRKESPEARKENVKTGDGNADQEEVMTNENESGTGRENTTEAQDLGKLRSIVIEDEDGYVENGEGLLSNVGNLESVIETIQLTDKYLEV